MPKGPPTSDDKLTAGDGKYAVIVARWNSDITDKLRDGAVETLRKHGASDEQIDVMPVPGSFELPQAASWAAESGSYVAVIALGVVIRGETQHHEYINHAVAEGLTATGQQWGIPCMFGVLTTENEEQAVERAGGKFGNKGEEAVLVAMEMVQLRQTLSQGGTGDSVVGFQEFDISAE